MGERERKRFPRKRLLALISACIGIVLGFIGVELLAVSWLTLQDGQYRSARELFAGLRNTYIEDVTQTANCRYVDTLFPHPYLAFVHHAFPPCGAQYINNIGLSATDFPSTRTADRYVVLLTGGSVAAQLGQYKSFQPRFLEEELNARFASPTGKPFLVLNGGAGAWKQPQQTILFALYAEVVDAVVTLDGYNEQYAFKPGVITRLEYPGNNFLDVNPIVAKDGFGGLVVSWLKARAAGWLSQGLLADSHAAFLMASALAASANANNQNDAALFMKMMALPQSVSSSPQELFSWQLAQYAKYLRVMNAIARDYETRAMFFLQPVPAIGKVLTEDEKRASPDLSYGVRYGAIVAGLESLRNQGIDVRSLLHVFDREKETIYADDIHPFRSADGESRGYRLIAAEMAKEMASAWHYQPK
jgi:hypothetical protein